MIIVMNTGQFFQTKIAEEIFSMGVNRAIDITIGSVWPNCPGGGGT